METNQHLQGFKSIIEVINYFNTEEKCSEYLAFQKWGDNPTCPYCENNKIYLLKGENKRYKCSSCRKQFSVRVGTIFEDSKIPLQKWFLAIWIVTSHKKGISSLQLHRDLNVTQKTAWFMLQRIRYALSYDFNNTLNGEVEVDETFIGGKETNKHLNKQSKNTKIGDKATVMGMVERGGVLTAKKVDNRQANTLTTEILSTINETAKIYTDEHAGYKGLKRVYDHQVVKHKSKQYVNGRVHTNTIEGFWSLLKRGIFGIYHFTSKKHLQAYVDEFVFRYNTRDLSESFRFQFYLSQTEGRLTYKELISR